MRIRGSVSRLNLLWVFDGLTKQNCTTTLQDNSKVESSFFCGLFGVGIVYDFHYSYMQVYDFRIECQQAVEATNAGNSDIYHCNQVIFFLYAILLQPKE